MKDTAFYYVTIISLWMKTYGIITPMEAFNGHLYLVLLVFFSIPQQELFIHSAFFVLTDRDRHQF